jgi:hypothetical protein
MFLFISRQPAPHHFRRKTKKKKVRWFSSPPLAIGRLRHKEKKKKEKKRKKKMKNEKGRLKLRLLVQKKKGQETD